MRIAAVVLFSFACWQVFWWRGQAVRITQMQVGSITRSLTIQDRLEWGAICNGLEDYECAAEAFASIIKRSPNHRLALVNWAIAEARMGQCAEALELFERYRSLGPDGPEALHWQGKCLLRVKLPEQAMTVLYAATATGGELTKAPEELVDLLFEDGRVEEALSIIGALSEGRPSRSPRWRQKYADLIIKLQWREAQVGEDPDRGKSAVRIPSLDGQRFWMPVRYSANTPVEFVIVDLEQPNFEIDEDELLQVPFDMKGQAREPADSSPTMKLDTVQVGPWFFRDVEFKVCRQCTSSLGRSVLDHFEVSEDVAPGVRFLTLTPN
jgi:tetratricopeptide (TPR) repeat protein